MSVSVAALTHRLLAAARQAAPAIAVYAFLRLAGVLILAIFAADAGRNLWALLSAYDGYWYLNIAANGYDTAVLTRPDGSLATTNLAFAPLYPALIWVLDPILPQGPRAAGLAISGLAGLAAAWGLFAVGSHVRNRRTGIMLAAAWAVVPHGVVQSMLYTETLFTALAAWSLYCVLRRQWLAAGVLCLLAGLTRSASAALIAAVGLAALVAVWRDRERRWRALAAAILAPLGLLGFLVWVGWRLGRLDGYFYVQGTAWGSSLDGGQYTLRTLSTVLTKAAPLQMYAVTGVLFLALLLFVLAVADRIPWPLLVFAAATVLLAVGVKGYYHSKARLIMPAFPLLLPVATALAAARPRVRVAVLVALCLASAWYGVYLCLVWGYSP